MENIEKQNGKIPKTFVFLMIIGPILIALGIALIILGVKDNSENMVAFMIPGGFTCVCGLVCFMFGIIPLMLRLPIKAIKYVVSRDKEGLKDIADTGEYITNAAAHKISKSVASGAKEGLQNEKKFCKYCGEGIDKDSKFCKKCGKEL